MNRFIVVVGILGLAFCLGSCHGLHEGYLDLSTGQEIEVVTDAKTGTIINKNTGNPLYILVDVIEDDTIYAKTGEVINGRVVKKPNNKFVYEKDAHLDADSLTASADSPLVQADYGSPAKIKNGDYKIKQKKNGDIKIKDGDHKIIIDGKTGQEKIKN